jgi:dihydrodipicolinate synthase/N-acetylneuraminate lyase
METLAELAKHLNTTGIKVSTNDLLYYHKVVRMFKVNPKISVLMGEDHSLLPALSLGGNEVVSFLSNIIP